MYMVAQWAFSKLFYLCPVHLLAPTAECSGATCKDRVGQQALGWKSGHRAVPYACPGCESLASPTHFQHKPMCPETNHRLPVLHWETKTTVRLEWLLHL